MAYNWNGMEKLSWFRRLQYGYLGRLYGLAFWANTHRLLGIRYGSWLRWLPVGLLLFAWAGGWPSWLLVVLVGVVLWVQLSFWSARRANYNRFVVMGTGAAALAAALQPLAANRTVMVRATGLFGVTSRESQVVLRPARYWRVPLGEHIIMVEERPGKYLYQFFNAPTLLEVREGWLIFGREPLLSLAITFLSRWGPAYTNFQIYELGDGQGPPPRRQTVYLTFEDEEARRGVLHTIVYAAREGRRGGE
jgi:hypothetical protein